MDRFDFLHCNMIGNMGIAMKYVEKQEYCMHFEKRLLAQYAPSQNHRRATLPSVLLFSRESRAKTVPEQLPPAAAAAAPVSQSLPGTQNLLNKQQFATQNYLTLFRALLPPLLPLIRRTADKCFFPACSFNICHPKSGVGRRSREVCLSRRRRTGLFCKELKQLRAIESDGPDCDIIVLADFVTVGVIGEKAVAVPVAPRRRSSVRSTAFFPSIDDDPLT